MIARTFLWGLAVCGLIATSAAAKITVGPMVQNGRPDGVTITWESDLPTAAVLTISLDGKDFKTIDVPASDVFNEIKVDGLKPATVYGYAVKESGGSTEKGESGVPSNTTVGMPFSNGA